MSVCGQGAGRRSWLYPYPPQINTVCGAGSLQVLSTPTSRSRRPGHTTRPDSFGRSLMPTAPWFPYGRCACATSILGAPPCPALTGGLTNERTAVP